MKKKFANRIILIFSFVVFGGFLLVYVLFNQLMDNHIRREAEAVLHQEVSTVRHTGDHQFLQFISGNVSPGVQLFNSSQIIGNRGTFVGVNHILLDDRLTILSPSVDQINEEDAAIVTGLANFWHENLQMLSETDDMQQVTVNGHSFYMRMSVLEIFGHGVNQMVMLTYTDITPAMTLKTDMNQILIILLAASGVFTLISSFVLAFRFKEGLGKLSKQASVIGTGDFSESLTDLGYAEFDDLAANLNHMASMLAGYEVKQKQFFQNASHELRTPLTSIIGYTEGIASGVFSEPVVATSVILEESDKMSTLIDEILYLSKLTETHLHHKSSTPINQLLNEVTAPLTFKEIKFNADETTDINLQLDSKQIKRAISNVLTNATRYAKTEIVINTKNLENSVIINLSNDGPPINESDLPYIFDRFYKGAGGNTGLGLAIAKEIIIQHKGIISAKNNENSVCFKITLPKT